MEQILGIDYGDVRTGIAISDLLGITAQPLETVNNNGDDDMLVTRILELVKQYKIKTLVFGYPKNMNGTIGPRAEKTEAFIEKLLDVSEKAGNAPLEIVKKDERLTSVIAERAMTEMGIKKKNKRKLVDKLAAVQILQGYLDIKN